RRPAFREAMAASRASAAPVRGPAGAGGAEDAADEGADDGAEEGTVSFRASDHCSPPAGAGAADRASSSDRGAVGAHEVSGWGAGPGHAGASGGDAGPAPAKEPGCDPVPGCVVPSPCGAAVEAAAGRERTT